MIGENSTRIFWGSYIFNGFNRTVLILCILLQGLSIIAQPTITWDQTFGNDNFEEMRDIVQCPDGNYLVGGHTSSGIGNDVTVAGRGASDYWIVKFDPAGNKIWDIKFGGEQQETIAGLTALSDGNFVVYGWSHSGMQFDKSQASWGGYPWANDYWIVKFDQTGAKLWDQSYGGDNFDQLWDLEEMPNGDLILGGMSASPTSGNKTDAFLGGGWDMWVIRTDASGNKLWDRSLGGSDADMCFTVAPAADGGIYVGGLSSSPVSGTKTVPNLGSNDFYLVKLNAVGTFQWDRVFGGTSDDQLRDIIVANDGNLLLAGWSNSAVGGNKTEPNYGSNDFYLIKTNILGAKIWERSLGGTGNDQAWMVRENLKNIIGIAGGSNSTTSGTKTTGNQGGTDLWLNYLDQSGTFIVDQNFGGSASDNTASILFTSDNGLLIGGNSSSPVSGDKTAPNLGFVDEWVLKLDCDVQIPQIDSQFFCLGNSFNVDVTTPFACSYAWNDGNTNPIRTLTPTTTTNYSVIVTDFNGCSEMEEFTITVYPLPVVDLGPDDSYCQGDSILLDAENPGQNYLWNTSETTQSIYVSTPGTYSVVVTDGNTCSSSDEIIISDVASPVFNLGSNQTICPNTTITLDPGITGQSYNWSTSESSPTIDVSDPGTYYLTVTNAANCFTIDSITIDTFTAPQIFLGNDTTICENSNLLLDAQNIGANFSWSTSEGTQTISVSTPDTYSVIVTDSNNCTAEDEIIVSNHNLPVVDLGPDQSTCQGDSILLDGENSGADYLWSTSEITQMIYVQNNGIYSVVVTDGNGCSNTDDFELTLNSLPAFDLGPDQTICPNTDLILDPGLSGQTYNWSTSESSETITINTPGTYYLTITNSNNCSDIDSITIDLYTPPVVDLGMDTTICQGADLALDAGNPGLGFLWSTLETTQVISVSTPGTYSVVVTDTNNCTAEDEIIVSNHNLPVVDLGPDQSTCQGDSILLDAENSGADYLWSTSEITQTIYVQNNGIYSVVVTDGNGCSNTDDFELTLNSLPAFDLGPDQTICPNTDLILDPGLSGQTYNWSTSESSETITINTPGTYYLTITNADNCSDIDSITVDLFTPPVVDLGMDTTICQGADLVLDAGNPGLGFLWSTLETTQVISVSTPGTYSVVVTDTNNCTSEDEIIVSNHSLPVVDLGPDQSTCQGDSILLDGENSGADYLWSTSEITQTIYVQNNGIYSVVVTDGNGCSNTDDFELTLNSLPAFDLGPDQTICPNTDLILDPGLSGQTYNWSTSESSETITINTPGTYYLTITNADNCSDIDSITVDLFTPPVVDLGMDTTICQGADLVLDAGNPGLGFLWSTLETTQVISVSTPGTYSVVVTDTNNCTSEDEIIVSNHSLPVVDLGPDQFTCQGDSILLDAENSGADYLWSTSEITQTIYVQNNGIYSVVVTDGNGCSNTDDFELTLNSLPAFDLGPNQTICPNTDLILDPGLSGQTYNWSTSESSETITINTPGTYYLTITNSNNCSDIDSITIDLYSPPVVDLGMDTTICQGADLALDAGNPGLGFLWSTLETTQVISVSTPGTYSVVVTDANNCTAEDEIIVSNHNLPVVDLGPDQSTCQGDSILLDGENSGADYLWSTSEITQTIYVQNNGIYSVVVTDGNGCSNTDDFELTLNSLPAFDLGPNQTICPNTDLILDPGLSGQTYNWSTSESSETITINTPGTYYLTITNADNCSDIDSITIDLFTPPVVDLGMDTTICEGADLVLDAGNPGLGFLWSTLETTQTISVSAPGTYSVVVTDANNCTSEDSITVSNFDLPIVDLGADQAICLGDSILLDAQNIGADYLWSTLEITQTIFVQTTGTFVVTATDGNSCSNTDSMELVILDLPVFDLGPDQTICPNTDLILDPGLSGQTYNWSTSESSETITINTPGTYYLTITNSDNCSDIDSITIDLFTPPVVDLGMDTTICEGADLVLDAGNPGLGFLWSTLETTQTISVSAPGTYSVVVTDANNCTSEDSITVSNFDLPIVDLGADQAICLGDSILLDAENSGADYLWSTSEITQTIFVQTAGTFVVTVTDGNSCSNADSMELVILDLPVFDLGPNQTICPNTDLILDPGLSGQTYNWSTSESSETITINTPGTYYLTITNADNCSDIDSITVDLFTPPVVDLGMDTTICEGADLVLDAGNPGLGFLWSTLETTQTISVSAPGTYSVVVTDANNCTSEDSITVSNFDLPIVDLGADQAICFGDSILLDAENSGANYLWSTLETSQTIFVQTAGTFVVTVTDGNSCSNADSMELVILDLPVFDLGPNQTICPNTDLILDPGLSGQNYNWSTSESSETITINTPGTYYLTITNADNCSDIDSITIDLFTPPVVDLGLDTTICEGTDLVLDAGNPGLGFLWSTLETTQTISVSAPGTYSVVVTDANNCTAEDFISVSNFDLPIVDLGADQSICFGDSILLDAENSGADYLWSTIETSQTIFVQTAGTFVVTVTDGNSCSNADSMELVILDLPVFDLGPNQTICPNTDLILDPGLSGQTYNWSTSESSETITINSPGTYYLTITNADNCSDIDSITIDLFTPPVVDLGMDTTICEGADLVLDAGNPGLGFLWSTLETTQTISVSAPGTYSVVVTDANNCTSEDSITVSNFDLPIVDLGADQAICLGDSILLDAENSGADYLWSTLETSQTIFVQTAGTFVVTVTDGNSCSNVDSMELVILDLPVFDLGPNQTICPNTDLILDPGLSGQTYNWSTSESSETITINTPGTYYLTITNADNCSDIDSITVDLFTPPVVDLGMDTTICEGADLVLDAGNPGLGFLWSTLETTQTISVSAPGIYSVVVTDANNCTAEDSISVSNFDLPIVDLGADQAICLGDSILLDAENSGADYLWSTLETSQTIFVQTAGTFVVTVTDGNSCSNVDSMELVILDLPVFDLGPNQTICPNTDLILDPGLSGQTYNWSTSESSETITINTPGTYYLTITNADNCSDIDSITVDLFTPPVVDLGMDTTICEGADLVLDAGNPGLGFLWSTLETTQTISVSAPGIYSVVVTDANNCTAEDSISVSNFDLPIVDLGADQAICFGDSILLDAQNTGADYLWSTLETSQTIFVQTAGTFVVTVTDGNSCSTIDSMELVILDLPVFDLGPNQTICPNTDLILDPGLSGQTYNWSTSESSETITINTPGTYYLTITNSDNCSDIDSITIDLFTPPVVDLGMDTTICEGADLVLDAGNPGLGFLWSTLETTQTISVSAPGTYSVVVTDANNCTSEDSITVSNFDLPIVDLGADQAICLGDSILLDAQNTGADYLWSTLETSQTIFVQTAGTFVVTVTDGNSCSSIDSMFLTINPTRATDVDSLICQGSSIEVNGNLISTAGIYVDSLDTHLGCDSLVTINLSISPWDSIYTTEFSCSPLDTGLVVFQDINQIGCDSFTFVNTVLNPSSLTFEQVETCDSLMVGMDTIFSTNIYNCDSLHVIETVLLPSNVTLLDDESCHASDVGVDTLIIAGQFCDSTIITTTTFIEPDTFNIQENTCFQNLVGIDTLVNPNIFGCDSVTILTTLLSPLDTIWVQTITCDQNIIGFDTTLVAGTPCDTTLVTEYILDIIPPVTINLTSCIPNEVGIDTVFSTSSQGCDSTTFIITDLLTADTLLNSEFTCDPLLVGFDTSYISGPVCDTTVITEFILDIIPPVTINQTSCDPMEVGIDTIFATTLDGCDSTTFVITALLQGDTIFNTENTCDPLLVGFDTTSITGPVCDTTLITEYILTIIPSVTINETSCDPMEVGIDTVFATTLDGCDSTTYVITTLIAGDTIFNLENTCDPLLVGFDTTSISGPVCDTTLITEYILTIIPSVTINETSCDPMEVGIDTVFATTLDGCDSTTYVITTLITGDTIFNSENTCDPLLVGFDTTSISGPVCDTTLITEYILTVIPPITINDTSCDPLEVGIDTIFAMTPDGCDSNTFVITTLIAGDTIFNLENTCDPLLVGFDTTSISGPVCDTTLITEYILTVIPPITINDTSCDPMEVGIDTILATTPDGCDSTTFVITTLITGDTIFNLENTCDPLLIGFDTTSISGPVCDTTLITEYILTVIPPITINETSCDPLEVGIDTVFAMTPDGCDSTTFVITTLITGETIFNTESTCDPLMAGFDTTLIAGPVCDTTVITEYILTVIPPVTINQTSCDPMEVGIDTVFAMTPNGCDSTTFVITTLITGETIFNTENTCDPLMAGFDTTLIAGPVCDTTLITEFILTVIPPVTINQTSCDPMEVGIDTVFAMTPDGCDSTTFVITTLITGETIFNTENTCDPLMAGFDTTLIAGPVCDTTLITEYILTVIPPVTINQTSCDPMEIGIDTVFAMTPDGCDSTTFVITTLINGETIFSTENTCDPLMAGFDTTLIAGPVCDTTLITEYILTVIPPVTINQTSCDPMEIGIDTVFAMTPDGCDSTTFVITTLITGETIFNTENTCDPLMAGFDTTLISGPICDTTLITEYILTVIPPVTINQTSCDPLEVGIDTVFAMTPDGCDSTTFVITTLITGETIFSTENTCDPLMAGFDTTLIAGPVCDTTLITEYILTVIPQVTINQTSCDPMEIGIDTVFAMTPDGCDSTTFVITTLINGETIFNTENTCDPLMAGFDTTLIAGPVCDTTLITEYILTVIPPVTINQTSCDPMEVGIDTVFAMTPDGCDSTTFVITTLITGETIFNTENTCDPLMAGFDTTLIAGPVCDTTLITEYILTVIPPVTIDTFVCDPLLVGVDTIFDTNQNGCISLTIINSMLTTLDTVYLNSWTCDANAVGITTEIIPGNPCDVLQITSTSLYDCSPTEIFLETCDLDSVGIFQDTLINIANLDSIVITNISISPPDTIHVESFSCNPQDTTVIITQFSAQGDCQLIQIETVRLLESNFEEITSTSCDPNDWIDTMINLVNVLGCDSIIHFQVLPSAPSFSILTEVTCDPAEIGRDTIDILTGISGCDSLVIVETTFKNLASEIEIQELICPEDQGAIIILPSEGTAPFLYSINNIPLSSNNAFANLDAGLYQILVEDAEGCIEEIQVTLAPTSSISVELPEDVEIELGDQVSILALTNTSIDTFIWSSQYELSCWDCLNPDIQPLATTQVGITIINADGCEAEDRMNIIVSKDEGVYIPNVFSPNNDGNNDQFTIFADESVASVDHMLITDRWGEIVFKNENVIPGDLSGGWNGYFKGRPMNPAVFIYMFEVTFIDGRTEIFSGDLTLIR